MTLSAFLPLVGVDTDIVLDRVQRAAGQMDVVGYDVVESRADVPGVTFRPMAVVWVNVDMHGRTVELAGDIERRFQAEMAEVWPGYEESGVDVLLRFVA